MKIFAPRYYKDFTCIADKCSHSCCIGWEIDIDDKTMGKYSSLCGGYGENIKNSIDTSGSPHFRLADRDRCPHLNNQGLCRIILELGEDHLCDICREHPRFYNDTIGGREVGLGIACEEAARLVLSSDTYRDIVEVGDDGEDAYEMPFEINAISEREKIYAILSDRSRPYSERLKAIYAENDVSPEIMSDEEWRELFSSLEYLDPSHKELFSNYSSAIYDDEASKEILERALAYFIFRHCSSAYDEEDLRSALGFCFVCERLLSSLMRVLGVSMVENAVPLAMAISEELEYSEENTDSIKLEFQMR